MLGNQVITQSLSVCKKSLEYHSFIAPTGYTQAAVDNLKSLISAGYNVSLKCVHGKMVFTGFNQIERKWLENLAHVNLKNDAINIIHAIPPRWKNIKFRTSNIVLFVFENKVIPHDWVHEFKKCNCVIVPSEFNKNSCIEAGIHNVHVVNHAINFDIWNLDTPPSDMVFNDDKVKIITVGTWRDRKNWKSMFEAILEIIKDGQEIFWTLKVDRGNSAKENIESWFSEFKLDDSYKKYFTIDSRILDESSMARLIKSHHILLSASFGEGFGLPSLQAACIGIPVVCPKYGGYLEFFHEDSHVEVRQTGWEKFKKMDNLPQFANLEWPIYKKDSIRDALYLCISKCRNKQFKHHSNFIRFYDKFNHNVIGKKFYNIIENIHDIPSNKD